MLYVIMPLGTLINAIAIVSLAQENWIMYIVGIVFFLISCLVLVMKISAERAEITRKSRKPFENFKIPDSECKNIHNRLSGIMLILAGLALTLLIVMLFGLWIDPEYGIKLIYVLFMAFMIGIWALICFKNGINKIRTSLEEEE